MSSLWKTIENNFNELSTKKIGHRNKKSKNRLKKVIKYSTEGRKNKNQCLLFIKIILKNKIKKIQEEREKSLKSDLE